MAMRWYVVQAYSGFEQQVRRSLLDRINRESLNERFGQVLVPTEEVAEMRADQKRKRDRLEQQYGRPDPKAVLKDVTHLLEVVAGGQKHLTVLSDEHQAYPRAIR